VHKELSIAIGSNHPTNGLADKKISQIYKVARVVHKDKGRGRGHGEEEEVAVRPDHISAWGKFGLGQKRPDMFFCGPEPDQSIGPKIMAVPAQCGS
jgi:hypothetical protein